MGSHSVTCHLAEVRIPFLPPAETGTRFSDPGGMQGWVDLSYVKADRLGFEPATCPSQVRRPTAAPPRCVCVCRSGTQRWTRADPTEVSPRILPWNARPVGRLRRYYHVLFRYDRSWQGTDLPMHSHLTAQHHAAGHRHCTRQNQQGSDVISNTVVWCEHRLCQEKRSSSTCTRLSVHPFIVKHTANLYEQFKAEWSEQLNMN